MAASRMLDHVALGDVDSPSTLLNASIAGVKGSNVAYNWSRPYLSKNSSTISMVGVVKWRARAREARLVIVGQRDAGAVCVKP